MPKGAGLMVGPDYICDNAASAKYMTGPDSTSSNNLTVLNKMQGCNLQTTSESLKISLTSLCLSVANLEFQ